MTIRYGARPAPFPPGCLWGRSWTPGLWQGRDLRCGVCGAGVSEAAGLEYYQQSQLRAVGWRKWPHPSVGWEVSTLTCTTYSNNFWLLSKLLTEHVSVIFNWHQHLNGLCWSSPLCSSPTPTSASFSPLCCLTPASPAHFSPVDSVEKCLTTRLTMTASLFAPPLTLYRDALWLTLRLRTGLNHQQA